MSSDSYHEDFSRDSHSSLELFRASVERYAAIRVKKTMAKPAPTAAMVFGNAFHCRLLEPDKFKETYVEEPKIERRTNVGKAVYAEWLAANAGKIALSQAEWALLPALADAVMRNKYARMALEGCGAIEEPVEWQDGRTGLPLKCRPDIRLSNGLIIDLKTTNDIDPDSWSRTMAIFGYHRQAALYLDGCWLANEADGPFVHIAVSKEPPHECAVYQVGEESLELGRTENAATIAELCRRRTEHDWSGRWSADLTTVNLPGWYFKKERK